MRGLPRSKEQVRHKDVARTLQGRHMAVARHALLSSITGELSAERASNTKRCRVMNELSVLEDGEQHTAAREHSKRKDGE
jgi:hypothetical protein